MMIITCKYTAVTKACAVWFNLHSCAEGTLGLTPLYLIQHRLSVDPKAVA